MVSVNYNSMLFDALTGAIDFNTDTFKVLLTNGYVPDVDAHDRRDDVTGEVTGTGYTAGGTATTVTVTQDNANNRVSVAFSDPSWASATITADGAVVYKAAGGAASGDPLVAFIDFGGDVSSTNGTFTVDISAPIYFTNS